MPANSRSKKTSSKASKTATKKATAKVASKTAGKAVKKGAKKVAKKVAKKAIKKAAKKKTTRPQGSRKKVAKVSDTARRTMIEKAAYLRAEKRNFQNGDPVADWLFCEKEIEALLSKATR